MNQKLIVALGALLLVIIAFAALNFKSVAPEQVGSEDTNTPAAPEDSGMMVVGQAVEYFENATGYFAQPTDGGVYPGVVMIHENRGLRDEIKKAAEDLAAQGYQVLAVDLYKGTVMDTQEEARAYSSQYNKEEGVANMKAAVDFLRSNGAGKVASLGWCFGGAESLSLSTSGALVDATVIYYGRLTDDEAVLSQLPGPVLGIFGDQDQVVPVASVEAFEAKLAALDIPASIHMYEGVGHAFANPSNPNFAPDETADAWQKTLIFLGDTLR